MNGYEIIEENSEKVEAEIVLAVNPEEGEEITAATVVQITKSIGSAFKDVTVPSVLNKEESFTVHNVYVDKTTEENLEKYTNHNINIKLKDDCYG